ncbi:hypothetical protein HBB16_16085 [Pseudonocardia sp. MCCB 268]|nr:hypothetical protein [Pseudonocardia cytotoxica]
MFTAFAPPAIEPRVGASGAKAVVTDADQRAKLDQPVRSAGASSVVVGEGRQAATTTSTSFPARHDGDEAPSRSPLGLDGVLTELFTSPAPLARPAPRRSRCTRSPGIPLPGVRLDLRATTLTGTLPTPGWGLRPLLRRAGPLAAAGAACCCTPSSTRRPLGGATARVTNSLPRRRSTAACAGSRCRLAWSCGASSSAGEPLNSRTSRPGPSRRSGVTVRDHYARPSRHDDRERLGQDPEPVRLNDVANIFA